jgi:hypothetical protein
MNAEVAITAAHLSKLHAAIQQYRTLYGRFPVGSGSAVLSALRVAKLDQYLVPAGVHPKAGYMPKERIILDAWGRPIVFLSREGLPFAYSVGSNGIDEGGNGDDIAAPLR